jgi:hypothetical protein
MHWRGWHHKQLANVSTQRNASKEKRNSDAIAHGGVVENDKLGKLYKVFRLRTLHSSSFPSHATHAAAPLHHLHNLIHLFLFLFFVDFDSISRKILSSVQQTTRMILQSARSHSIITIESSNNRLIQELTMINSQHSKDSL